VVDFRLDSDPFSLAEKSTENIRILADQLAKILQQTVEFQELLRLARLVNLDPEVSRLIQQIRSQESVYNGDENGVSIEELEAQLEALPSYQAYVRAENSARDLFQSVDQAIGAAAGVDFAVNARRKGCSCGG
jgi:cell fate (sporulation/competence/biofilm development) regulator YlbF (YheA/YmcA/DUF963 family)